MEWLVSLIVLVVVLVIGGYIIHSFVGFSDYSEMKEGFVSIDESQIEALIGKFASWYTDAAENPNTDNDTLITLIHEVLDCDSSESCVEALTSNPAVNRPGDIKERAVGIYILMESGTAKHKNLLETIQKELNCSDKISCAQAFENLVVSHLEGFEGGTTTTVESKKPDPVSDKNFKKYMREIVNRTGATLAPTQKNLELAGNGSDTATPDAAYVPHQEKIFPHEFPSPTPSPLTPIVPTDRGTGVDAIINGAYALPSVRDLIRDDNVPRDTPARIENAERMTSDYEVTYERL